MINGELQKLQLAIIDGFKAPSDEEAGMANAVTGGACKQHISKSVTRLLCDQ